MPTTWQDSTEAYEAYGDTEAYGDAEAYGDSEAYGDAEAYGEETRAERERQRRARIALAQRRADARARSLQRPIPFVPGPTPRQAISAVRDLDLESKVSQDRLRGGLKEQSKRMTRAEYAATASVIVDQAFDSFDFLADHTFVRAGLRFAPLLLLAPQRRGSGIESIVTDPRVIGAAAVAGIAIFGNIRQSAKKVRRIDILSRNVVTVGGSTLIVGHPVDGDGTPVNLPISWSSSDTSIATVTSVDATTGKISATNNTGDVVITATADGISVSALLTVTNDKS